MDFEADVTEINHVVQLGTHWRKYWFRGHAETVGKLTPRVFRSPHKTQVRDAFPPPVEQALLDRFRRRAPAVTAQALPPQNDLLGWWALMQHHRTPTRLLDWTENVLVALYFSVVDFDNHHEDGELWIMDPYALTQASTGPYALPIARENKAVEFLAKQPIWAKDDESLAEDLGLKAPPVGPLPVPPIQDFERIVAQQATLTIHPEPEEGNRLTDLLTEPKALYRYRIPAGSKEELRQDLEALGCTAGRLFPDLDGLSRELEHGERTFGEPAKEPPELG